jgi:D-alanine transaminase
VSPLDRGFLYGDGVYEVIPVYSRRAFRIGEHLTRLQATLAGIKMTNPLDQAGWQAVIEQLIAAAPWDDQSIYLQVTRGADNKRDHAFPPASVPPGVFAFASPLVTPSAETRAQGVSAISLPDQRWARCDLKVISLLANVLARQQAIEEGCAEALLIRDGYLKEGAASNVFVVKDGVLLAPPKTHLMLPGITYDVVLELAQCHGQPLEVREIHENELRGADEVWMTSSTKEILAITQLDGQPVGHGEQAGKPGPLGETMWQWYQDFKNTVMRKG